MQSVERNVEVSCSFDYYYYDGCIFLKKNIMLQQNAFPINY
jgi:hypothetical protein